MAQMAGDFMREEEFWGCRGEGKRVEGVYLM
jgi:hypothetical protein